MKKNSLSVIIVSYNTRKLTIACILSVFLETKGVDFDIIVVDNCSTDGSADFLEQKFNDNITLVRNKTNVGFAAANNYAAQQAPGDLLLLLNPDTIVLDGAIDALVDFSSQYPDAGIWGGLTFFPDGSLNPTFCWQRQTLWSLFCQAAGLTSLFRNSPIFNPEGAGRVAMQKVRTVDIVSGCFFLIKKDLWQRLGGFDPEFFMYGEEADLCLRAKKLGAQPMVTHAARIIHYGGASETVAADKLVRLLRAKMLLIDRHFHPMARKAGFFLLALWPLSRFLFHRVRCMLTSGKEPVKVWGEVWARRQEWIMR